MKAGSANAWNQAALACDGDGQTITELGAIPPSEIEVPTKFPLDICFVFLIAGPRDNDHFLVRFACSPFHKQPCIRADWIAKLPTVAIDDLPNLFAYHVGRGRV